MTPHPYTVTCSLGTDTENPGSENMLISSSCKHSSSLPPSTDPGRTEEELWNLMGESNSCRLTEAYLQAEEEDGTFQGHLRERGAACRRTECLVGG